MDFYTEQGYLNIDEIASAGAWLNVIIGARQVGKTYGALKYHLDNNIPHILLRRTSAELELIGSSPELNPYKVFAPEYDISIDRKGKYYLIKDNAAEQVRGLALSLSQIAHIRGFNGSAYQSIVFDEFIPEKSVVRRGNEGDALLNAYTTINGNRELNGQPPCKLWLLANSNDVNSPILEALNLTDIVLNMRRKHIEIYINNGVCVVQPLSTVITQQRADTALMRQIRRDGEFYGMSINNEFSYDESPLIKNFPLKGMTPLFSYDNTLYAWEDADLVYICRASHNKRPYKYSGYGREQLRKDYAWLVRAYAEELIYFSDMRLLALFKSIFDIDF